VPKHPGNRQLYDKRGRPDAHACLGGNTPNPKAATFCAALWLTFTLPLKQSAPAAFTHGSKALFVQSSGIHARDRKYIKKRYDFANYAAPYIFGTCQNFRQKG
jgi:hypothetical protein